MIIFYHIGWRCHGEVNFWKVKAGQETRVTMNEVFWIGESASCKVQSVLVYLHAIRNSSHTLSHKQGCGKPCKRVKNDISLLGILPKKVFDQAFCITNIIILKDGWKGIAMRT